MQRIAFAIASVSLLLATMTVAAEPEALDTIEGECRKIHESFDGKRGTVSSLLIVDTLNGKKLTTPRVTHVSGVRFPVHVRFKVRGYDPWERAHRERERSLAAGELPEDVGPSEVVGLDPKCQITYSFVPVEVIAPADFKLPPAK